MSLKPKKNLRDVSSWFFADYCGKLLRIELEVQVCNVPHKRFFASLNKLHGSAVFWFKKYLIKNLLYGRNYSFQSKKMDR
jgi:hypothetical protein